MLLLALFNFRKQILYYLIGIHFDHLRFSYSLWFIGQYSDLINYCSFPPTWTLTALTLVWCLHFFLGIYEKHDNCVDFKVISRIACVMQRIPVLELQKIFSMKNYQSLHWWFVNDSCPNLCSTSLLFKTQKIHQPVSIMYFYSKFLFHTSTYKYNVLLFKISISFWKVTTTSYVK